jgi:transcriptional regulator, tetR family
MKDHSYQLVLDSIVADYPLNVEEAGRLYQHLFIYSHGMASMVASGIYQFSMEEVIGLLTEVCQSLIKEMVGKK